MRIPSVLADPFGQGMNSGQGSVVSGHWSVVSGKDGEISYFRDFSGDSWFQIFL